MATTAPTPTSVPQNAVAPGPFASASLYVGELHPDVTEVTLFDIFKQVGPVASIRVCRDAITRRSLGYAYVNFHSVQDAERALDTLNYHNIGPKPCRIMWSHRDPAKRKSGLGNVFIKNLSKTIDHQNLFDTFSDFGNILSCKVELDENGVSKGYGYVHYETEEEADLAISKVNGMILEDRVVSVSKFKPKKEREKEVHSNFTNVFVKNLPHDCTEQELTDLFSQFGEIQSLVVMKDKAPKYKRQRKFVDTKDDEKKPKPEEGSEIKKDDAPEEDAESKRSDEKKDETKKEEEEPLSFGFINYTTTEDAQSAVQHMDGFEYRGFNLYVGRAQKKSERQQELRNLWEQKKSENLQKYHGVNLYVKNLDDSVTKEMLRQEFAHCGNITSTTVMTDEKGNSRGFGFVCFSSPEEATKAVTEMNGHMLNNKPIYVALAQRKDVRKAQLEAQHAQRAQSGMRLPQGMSGALYPPNPAVFYGQGVPPGVGQRVMYQPNTMPRPRWQTQGQGVPQPRPGGVYPQQPIPGYVSGASVPLAAGRAGQPGGGRGSNPATAGRGRGGISAQPKGGPPRGGQPQGAGRSNFVNPKQSAPRPQFQVPANQAQGLTPLPSAAEMAASNPEDTKQLLGERLYLAVFKSHPEDNGGVAGKITGMILEYMDISELLNLLDDEELLNSKVSEALEVLKAAEAEGEEAGDNGESA